MSEVFGYGEFRYEHVPDWPTLPDGYALVECPGVAADSQRRRRDDPGTPTSVGLDLDADALLELAAQLGSDVPFFVTGGAALAEGRGERLTPLPPAQGGVVVMAPLDETDVGKPRGGDASRDPAPPLDETDGGKTAAMYALLRPEHYSDGRASDEIAQRLRAGAPASDWGGALTNAFEAVAPQAHPLHAAMRDAFEAEGMRPLLCGSGPAMFAITPDAPAVAKRLRRAGWPAQAVRLLPAWDAFA